MERMPVNAVFTEKMQNGLPVFAQLVQMGKDCTICVWGGEKIRRSCGGKICLHSSLQLRNSYRRYHTGTAAGGIRGVR